MSFFFQAEDGIRDIGVTGVQTCSDLTVVENIEIPLLYQGCRINEKTRNRCIQLAGLVGQIGRASCRERVLMSKMPAFCRDYPRRHAMKARTPTEKRVVKTTKARKIPS